MSSIKNEIKTKVISDNNGKSIHQFEFQGNPIENEERKEQDLSKSNANNEENININSKTRQELIKTKKRKILCKERIFKIIKIRRHNCFSNDNNACIIIRHFVNFFLNFINLVINEILRNENINKKIDFKINYVIKRYITIDFITSKKVEDLLKFKLEKNHKRQIINSKLINMCKKQNEKNYIIDNEKSVKANERQITKLKNIKNIESQLNKLFETKIIDIFKELYVKNKIDLSLYGIDGNNLDLDKKFQTFEKIRDKYKDDEKKLQIFDNLIKDKFIAIKFKTKRKK
jgi:hypothetical protein